MPQMSDGEIYLCLNTPDGLQTNGSNRSTMELCRRLTLTRAEVRLRVIQGSANEELCSNRVMKVSKTSCNGRPR
jgi:hypothetical protein